MIKGWRNNPEWVRLYAETQKQRHESIMAAMKFRHELDGLLAASRINREAPLVRVVCNGD